MIDVTPITFRPAYPGTDNLMFGSFAMREDLSELVAIYTERCRISPGTREKSVIVPASILHPTSRGDKGCEGPLRGHPAARDPAPPGPTFSLGRRPGFVKATGFWPAASRAGATRLHPAIECPASQQRTEAFERSGLGGQPTPSPPCYPRAVAGARPYIPPEAKESNYREARQ